MALIRAIVVALGLSSCVPAFGSDSVLRVAPDFTRTDIRGNVFSLSAYRGKLVLLNFWATWCGPCLTEIPKFVVWQRTYGSAGLQIVGISMDDELAPVIRAQEKYQMDYPVLMGDPQLAERFGGVLGLPLSYLIDSDGRVVARYQGDLDLKRLESQIKSLLAHRRNSR
jgi:cytochrome c biogenesis protein CcmG, thiol:disulfide interchange protein DsbE